MRTIDVCPGTLAPGFDTYSPSCLRKVFEGKKVSHIMDLSINDDTGDEIAASINKISTSSFFSSKRDFNFEYIKLFGLLTDSKSKADSIFTAGCSKYMDIKELDRETVETMIDHIVVGRRIPGTRNYPVEIHWNF